MQVFDCNLTIFMDYNPYSTLKGSDKMVSEGTTKIDPEAVQNACNFAEKNICFIGNLSKESVDGTLSKFGHCSYGTTGVESQKGAIDLITDGKRDQELLRRILVQEAQSAVAEQESRAVALSLLGYEKYFDYLQKQINVPLLKPSSALASICRSGVPVCKLGLVGTSFDLNPEAADGFTKQYNIKVIFPEKGTISQLDQAFQHSIKLKGKSFQTELETQCLNQADSLLRLPDPPTHIMFCNMEFGNTLKRARCQYRNRVEVIGMLDVLRQLAIDFVPSAPS